MQNNAFEEEKKEVEKTPRKRGRPKSPFPKKKSTSKKGSGGKGDSSPTRKFDKMNLLTE